jgi:hypothetical protein
MALEIEHQDGCPDAEVTHICQCLMQFFEQISVEKEALMRANSDLWLKLAKMESRRVRRQGRGVVNEN